MRCRRGMATYIGRDTSKLKAKGGKWKYVTTRLLYSPGTFSLLHYLVDMPFLCSARLVSTSQQTARSTCMHSAFAETKRPRDQYQHSPLWSIALTKTDVFMQIHVRTRNARPRIQILALQVRASPRQRARHTTTINNRKTTDTLCRSLFMWYMWRIEDVDISVLQ